MENAEQEFVSVVREYERVIYKVCYLYTTPNATLNDLYQEVVLNLWKAFPKFRRECKISTWIYRIALNTCISFIRKEKNIPEIVTLTQEADRTEETDETQAMLCLLYTSDAADERSSVRNRRDTSHATATLPDDKPAGTIGKIHHPALSGREKLRRNCRNHRADFDKRCHQAQPHQRQIEKNE